MVNQTSTSWIGVVILFMFSIMIGFGYLLKEHIDNHSSPVQTPVAVPHHSDSSEIQLSSQGKSQTSCQGRPYGQVADVGGRKAYVVKAGDTLYGIADRYGIDRDYLVSLNSQIADTGLIHPGDCVYLTPEETQLLSSPMVVGDASAP